MNILNKALTLLSVQKYKAIPLICILFTACSPAKQAHKYVAEHPDEFARDCATYYPPKDSVVVRDSVSIDTITVPNEEWWKIDTVYQKGDTVKLDKICPPTKVITKTLIHDSVIYRENTAKVVFQEQTIKNLISQNENKQGQITQLAADRDGFKSKAHKWFWCFWILVVALGTYVFRKPILKVISTLIKF